MENIEKTCLHGPKRQNKFIANMICMKKTVRIGVRES